MLGHLAAEFFAAKILPCPPSKIFLAAQEWKMRTNNFLVKITGLHWNISGRCGKYSGQLKYNDNLGCGRIFFSLFYC